jgi:hypothetical protein
MFLDEAYRSEPYGDGERARQSDMHEYVYGRPFGSTPGRAARQHESVPAGARLGHELAAKGADRARTVRLRTNVDEWLTLGPDHPLRLRRPVDAAAAAGPVPYVEVRAGLEARLARAVYYELVELGEERLEGERQRFGVWSDGVFFALDDA